jgi:hypothetical protein
MSYSTNSIRKTGGSSNYQQHPRYLSTAHHISQLIQKSVPPAS